MKLNCPAVKLALLCVQVRAERAGGAAGGAGAARSLPARTFPLQRLRLGQQLVRHVAVRTPAAAQRAAQQLQQRGALQPVPAETGVSNTHTRFCIENT